jgi:hypothetical protein
MAVRNNNRQHEDKSGQLPAKQHLTQAGWAAESIPALKMAK